MKSCDSYAPSAPKPKSAPIKASFGKQTGQAAAAMIPPKLPIFSRYVFIFHSDRRLGFSARWIVLRERKVDRLRDLAEMRAREQHGRDRRPVERAVGLHQEQPRLGEERRLLDPGRGDAAAGRDVQTPLARLVDGYAVADGEVRKTPLRACLLGALFRIGAGYDRRNAALLELSYHAVQLARVFSAYRAVQAAVEHDHRKILRLLRGERPAAPADGVEFERGNGLPGFHCHIGLPNVSRMFTATRPRKAFFPRKRFRDRPAAPRCRDSTSGSSPRRPDRGTARARSTRSPPRQGWPPPPRPPNAAAPHGEASRAWRATRERSSTPASQSNPPPRQERRRRAER